MSQGALGPKVLSPPMQRAVRRAAHRHSGTRLRRGPPLFDIVNQETCGALGVAFGMAVLLAGDDLPPPWLERDPALDRAVCWKTRRRGEPGPAGRAPLQIARSRRKACVLPR